MTRLVLVVEDNPADVDLLLEALSVGAAADVRVEAASTGADALRRLRDRRQPVPDLVVLDLNLPAGSGHDVLGEIRRDPRLRLLPVIVLTSSAAPEDVRASYALGANSHVAKPDGLTRYLEVVGAIEQFWLCTAVLPPVEGPPSRPSHRPRAEEAGHG